MQLIHQYWELWHWGRKKFAVVKLCCILIQCIISKHCSIFFPWEKFWLPFLLAYCHFSFKLWVLCGCFLTSCLSEFILVLHVLEAEVLNLSRGDVFTLLPDDFNDLFGTWYAPCNKMIYLPLCVRCVRCGILRSALFCLKLQYFSHHCHARYCYDLY